MTAAIAEHAKNAMMGVVHTNARNVKCAKTTNAPLLYARTIVNAIKDACVMTAFALTLNACMTSTAENADHVLTTNA